MFSIPVPRSGITYSASLEWRLAAQFFHYTFEAFLHLSGEKQSRIVAAYRGTKQIEAVLDQEQAKRMKTASRKTPRR